MKKLLFILLLLPLLGSAQFDGQDTLHAVNIKATGSIEGSIITSKAWAYQDSNTVATSITSGVWTKVSNWTEGGENGIVTFNADTIFVTLTGDYQASVSSLSVAKTAGATAYVEFGFSINGADPLFKHRVARQITSADVGAMPMSSVLELTADDWVIVLVRNSTNSDDLTVRYGEFEIIKE